MGKSTPQILVLLTTVSTQQQARDLAKSLIAQKAAACVQIEGPIESYYHWEGRDHCDQEYRLVIKTSVAQGTRLRELIEDQHPYDQPQIITLQSVDVAAGYANWVEQQTAS